MKNGLAAIAALCATLMLVAGNTWSAEDVESRCAQYAKDDGIGAEDLAEYLAQCVAELTIADAAQESADAKLATQGGAKD